MTEQRNLFELEERAALEAEAEPTGPRPLAGSPFVVAYGAGVDSTAMLVGLAARGVRPDLIMFADTGAERPETYAFVPIMSAWLEVRGFQAVTTVRYKTRETTGYTTLEGEMAKNEVLPGLVFGRGSCSSKWKQDAQEQFLRTWAPALEARRAGVTILRAIGYDAGVADTRRACAAGEAGGGSARAGATLWKKDERFRNWYPLREWGWDRERCQEEIRAAGLPVPPKSACFFCPATTRGEIVELGKVHPGLLARAIAMEDRARNGKHKVGERGSIKGLAFKRTWRAIAEEEGLL